MRKEIDEFIEERTTNFSMLFTETFFLRYLSEYSKNDLLESIQKAKKRLNRKLENNIAFKLKEMGFNSDDTNK